MAEILTHLAFYAGWPNAWAAFRTAKEVYQDEGCAEAVHGGMFGLGAPNNAFCTVFCRKQLFKAADKSTGNSIYRKCDL